MAAAAAAAQDAAPSYASKWTSLTPEYHRVVIVGTGVSAIAMAIQLRRKLGVTDVALLEKGTRLGGTWAVNTYPGCACDIPALLYSYSFAQSGQWSKLHPGQEELRAYFDRVAAEYNVHDHTRFNTVVKEARFDDATGLWHLYAHTHEPDSADGDSIKEHHFVASVFISAVGGLSEPNKCDVPGAETFKGALFHSARWDASVDLKNKDVVVIGNGCTSVQLISGIKDEVKSITQFARSKHWLAPVPHNPFEKIPGWNWLIRHSMFMVKLQRFIIFWFVESTFSLVRLGWFGNVIRNYWRRKCIAHVKSLAPAKYHDKLIPTDKEVVVGCKRRIFDDNYLKALNCPHIDLVTDKLERIGEDYVIDGKGVKRHADVIILCNGFAPARAGFPMRVYGAHGEEQREHWEKYGNGGPLNYRTSLLANFPNLGFLMGTNSATGHMSVIFTSESQIMFLLEVFKPILRAEQPGWDAILHSPQSSTSSTTLTRGPTVEPTQTAELNDLNWTSKKMTKTVFSTNCGSWYRDATSGRITAMHPDWQVALRTRALFPDWRDLRYANLPAHLAGNAQPARKGQQRGAPATAPLYKRLGSAILGLGRLPLVTADDPAISYAKPYTGPEAITTAKNGVKSASV